MISRRALAAILIATPLAPLALAGAQPAPPAASGDLLLVQRHLQAVETMTARFSQTDRNGRTLAGDLTLKKPGRIRFQYEPGVPLLIVGDGRALVFVDYSVRQVSRWPVADSPLGVLINPERNLARFARIVPTGNDRVISVEARDPRRPEYGRITMVFARDSGAPAGLMLQGWVALDAQNNRTTIRLSNQQFNVAVNDSSFRWRDPRPAGARR